MAKKDKFAGTESIENLEQDLNAAIIEGDSTATESVEKTKSEAGAKISAAQKGVPKQRIIVTTQVGGQEPVEHKSLCDAIVSHGLSKEVDWFTARNALKSNPEWTTKGKIITPVAEDAPEGTEPVVEEYDVVFRLVDASWKNAPKTENETDEVSQEVA